MDAHDAGPCVWNVESSVAGTAEAAPSDWVITATAVCVCTESPFRHPLGHRMNPHGRYGRGALPVPGVSTTGGYRQPREPPLGTETHASLP
jgi:hypothetical protein